MKMINSVLALLFFISLSCFGQNVNDSSHISFKEIENNIIPVESFRLFTNPSMFRWNYISGNINNSFSNTFIPLGFVSGKDYIIQLNKKEFLQQISKNYQLTKPGLFQEILGLVQVGAAAALAGYHIYKYEIKKEKK